jgi:hypothetical protein
MKTQNQIHEASCFCETCCEGVSWTSIFAGVITAITIGFLFNLLGIGLGMIAFSPSKEAIENISLATISWLYIGNLLAMFFAGWVTCFLAKLTNSCKSFCHGFLVASLATIIMIASATTMIGNALSGTFGMFGQVETAFNQVDVSMLTSILRPSTLMQTAKQIEDNLPENLKLVVNKMDKEIEDMVKVNNAKTNNVDLATSEEEIKVNTEKVKEKISIAKEKVLPVLYQFVTSIDTPDYNTAKNNLSQTLAEITDKSPDEIKQTINNWQSTYKEYKDKIIQTAMQGSEKLSKFIAWFALTNFFIITSGLFLAGVGGVIAASFNENEEE